jgi:inorganic phosphate transporter, PiT family
MLSILAIAAALAWANGGNDTIKGAATLVGSGLLTPRRALMLAAAATAAGGLLSILLAERLLAAFGGRGLVPEELVGSAVLLVPAGSAAAATVALASGCRLPVSTTHALLGGLLGAAAMAAPDGWHVGPAISHLLVPLLLVPAIAIALALMVLPLLRRLRVAARAGPALCACEDPGRGDTAALAHSALLLGRVGAAHCAPGAARLQLPPERLLDGLHIASATAVSLARGLNDTPKIAAIALAGGLVAGEATLLVVVAMAAGGLMAGYRVADTMAFRVTRMDAAEGVGGNLVAALLVVGASPLGLPVSTTHVTCGALFGIGASNGSGRPGAIGAIVLAWLLTLPLAAVVAALTYDALSSWH